MDLHIDGFASASAIIPIGDVSLSKVSLAAAVPLEGLGGLKNVTISQFDLSTSNATAINVLATAVIVNPSSVTVRLGDVAFDVIFQGDKMGTLMTIDATLQPGVNSLAMAGTIKPAQADLVTASVLFSQYMNGQMVSIVAQPSADASSIPLINEGLQGLQLNTVVPLYTLPLVRSITFNGLFLAPNDDYTCAIVANVTIQLNSPLGPDALLVVERLNLTSLDLQDDLGNLLASAEPASPLSATVLATTSTTVTLSLSGSVSVESTNFPTFIQSFIQQTYVTVALSGLSNVEILTPAGSLTLASIPIESSSPLLALNGIPNVKVQSFDLTSSTSTSVIFKLMVNLNNPTIASVDLGQLNFDLFYLGSYMGSATTADSSFAAASLALVPNINNVYMIGSINPADQAIADNLFSDYVAGIVCFFFLFFF